MSTHDWFSAMSAQRLALNHGLRCAALTYSADQDLFNAKLVDAVDKARKHKGSTPFTSTNYFVQTL